MSTTIFTTAATPASIESAYKAAKNAMPPWASIPIPP